MLRAGLITLVLAVMVSCSQAHNQGHQSPTLAHLLPTTPAGWREEGKTLTFSGPALSDYIDGGAEAYIAYGFREVAVREFQNDSGARLTVEIYQMNRPENAYGIYSTDSAGEHWDIGAGASYGGGLLRFWKGPYFVRIMCFPQASEAVIKETGVKIAGAIDAESGLPEILKILPDEGVDPDTVCYFHRQTSLNNIRFLSDENVLHLGDDVEAVTWEQADIAGKLRQIVLRYPSESVATDALRDFTRKWLQLREMTATRLTAPTRERTYAAVSLKAPWLLIVLDAPTVESAGMTISQTEAKVSILTMEGKTS